MPLVRKSDTGEVRWVDTSEVNFYLGQGYEMNTQPLQIQDPGPASRLDNSTVLWKSLDGSFVVTVGTIDADTTVLREAGYEGPLPSASDLRNADYLNTLEYGLFRQNLALWYQDEFMGDPRAPVSGEVVGQADIFGDGSEDGGGGGGGGVGRTFQAQDPEALFETYKNYIVAVTGKLDDNLTNEAVAAYQRVNRANFDNQTNLNAYLAGQKVVQGSSKYKDIHKLRPESVDEMTYVTSQQGLLRQMGVADQLAQDLGIDLARVGASEAGATRAGFKAFSRSTGRIHEDQRTSLKNKGLAALRLL